MLRREICTFLSFVGTIACTVSSDTKVVHWANHSKHSLPDDSIFGSIDHAFVASYSHSSIEDPFCVVFAG
ncbi:hypothetical protein Lalb_Chr01g0023971 [Lupinus albus]|uniref:Secreted protein n=1 Tax=Lupinus albus TaxID=3870 RepID=A0A6A4R8V0_LUPAL|nr:hypothetical protein Lalb_Chr01g0023971 [Lupinus albus]